MANRKMYVISGGMIMCDLSNMVCMPVMGNAKQHEVTSIWAYSPVTCMLIENEEGLILFDTGCHPEAMTSRWNEENKLRTPVTIGENEGVLSALKMLGYQCSDVRYVVLSHLHEDHAGCLEFFPNAQVYVSDRELTQTLRSYALGGDMGGYIRNDITQWLRQGVKWNLVSDEEDEEDPDFVDEDDCLASDDDFDDDVIFDEKDGDVEVEVKVINEKADGKEEEKPEKEESDDDTEETETINLEEV